MKLAENRSEQSHAHGKRHLIFNRSWRQPTELKGSVVHSMEHLLPRRAIPLRNA